LLGKTRLFVKVKSCLGKSRKSVEKRFCGEKEISENPAFCEKKRSFSEKERETEKGPCKG